MKFKEIIDRANWDDVGKLFIEKYSQEEKNLEGYECVFLSLKSMKPVGSKDNMKICIVLIDPKDEWEGEERYIDIYGSDGITANDYHADRLERFALEMRAWNEWLGMEVNEDSLKEFSEIEIACHCLYEMTFMGFTEEKIQEFKKELDRRVEEIDNGTAKLIPMEEVMAHIDELKEKWKTDELEDSE